MAMTRDKGRGVGWGGAEGGRHEKIESFPF